MKPSTQDNLRLMGYTLTLGLHAVNLHMLDTRLAGLDLEQDRLKFVAGMRNRFFTSWNLTLQMIYALTGITCEILERRNANEKDYELPTFLRRFRDAFFAGVLWPSTFLTCTLFWSVYNYDRDLILPKFTEAIMTPVTNHVMHTAIVPIVLWEAVFRPRQIPRLHQIKNDIAHLTVYMLVYLSVLLYSYFETGQMMYPLFQLFAGTIYFWVIIGIIGVFVIFAYYAQWAIVWLLHDQSSKKTSQKMKLK